MTINVHPFSTNVLDLLDKPLVSRDGFPVLVRQSGAHFLISVDGKQIVSTNDNLSASRVLNDLCISYA